MKVLALLTESFGGRGGIAQYNRDLLTALSSDGCVQQILAVERNRSEPGVVLPSAVRRLHAGGGKASFARAALSAALFEHPIDVVFCGHLNFAPLARLAASLSRAKLWTQIHGIEAWSPPSGAVRRSVDTSRLVTAVSRYTRRCFLSWAECEPFRVRVLPNTVDAAFSPGPPNEALAGELGLAGNRVLLTVSRLRAGEAYKGHERVIRVLPELLQEYPTLVYAIAGDGPRAAELRSLARRCSVEHALRILGRVDVDHLPDLYRISDVFVMPSTGEGFGIVFLEAAACGLPVVAGAFDGSRDALADGQIGQLVDPDDLSGLTAAIRAGLERGRGEQRGVDRFEFNRFALHARSVACELADDSGGEYRSSSRRYEPA